MKITKKKQPNVDAKSVFVDREFQRYEFRKHLIAIKNSGIGDGLLLTYSGVGGIGKTFLLNKFKESVGEFNKNFVLYDFKNGNDMVAVLKSLRKKLSEKYSMEFPLFDKGCIYLAQKKGEYVGAAQINEILKSSSMFRSWKEVFSSLKNTTETTAATTKFLDSVDEELLDDLKDFFFDAADASVTLKVVKPFLDFVDRRIKKHEDTAREQSDENYSEVANALELRNKDDDSAHIRDFLPTLFAQDLSYWLNDNKTDLIIFLDTYEVLTGEELGGKKSVRLVSENRNVPVDWWIGEILAAERVMWVIASRYELNEIGEVTFDEDDVKSYTVDVLEKNWANEYLERLGVTEENLRNEIVKLTGGHPLYLHTCFVTYDNIIRAGKIPRPSDFGKNRDKIIERALGSFDDASLLMLQSLCILGRWTDELAAAAISDFNPNTYSRLTNLFAEEDELSTDDAKFVIYGFNRTITTFLLPGLKQDVLFVPVFNKIRDGANAYFQKFFAENRREYYGDDDAEIYCLSMWSDLILRTTDAPEKLMTLYAENLEQVLHCFDYSIQVNCAEKFFAKVGDNETMPSVYFQHRLGMAKFLQDRVKEALELEQAAYSKLQRLPIGDETRPLKIVVTNCLADIFRSLERWSDEINLREEIVTEYENYYPDADDERTLDAKENLARALEYDNQIDEAIEIRRQIVELLDGHDDEIFIRAAKKLAGTLERGNRYKAVAFVRKKIVDACEKTCDDEKVIDELWRLAFALKKFSDQETLKENLACLRKIFNLYETNGLAIPVALVTFIADILKKLGRDDEAAQVYKNFVDDLKCSVETCDEPDEKNFKLMVTLADALKLMGQFEEVAFWRERATDALKFIAEQICREPVKNYSNAISTLKGYSDFLDGKFYYEAQVVLWRKILAVTEKNPAATDKEIIDAKKTLTDHLRELIARESKDEYVAEELRLFAEVEARYKKIFPKDFGKFSSTFLFDQECFLRINLQDFPAAIGKRMEILDFVEKHPKATAKHIFDAMQKIAATFNYAEKFFDEAEWHERRLNFCREHFMEDAPETLSTLQDLSSTYKKLKVYDKAEHYQKMLVDLTEKKYGAEHSETLEEKERLARIFHDAGKLDEEAALRKEIGDGNKLPEDDDIEVDEWFEDLLNIDDEDTALNILNDVEIFVAKVKTLEQSDFR